MRKQTIKTTKDFCRERAGEGQSVRVINLGCSRNLVDSQVILGNYKRQGYQIVSEGDSDIAVVNTCGFIEDAKKESIEAILELIELKKQGKVRKVIVAGCLAQRYSKELAAEFKEVDEIVGVQKLDPNNIPEQVSLTPRHFAYVKICESCYNQCRFCVIPKIKGKFVSRTMESIVREVRQLDARGVKEIMIIGQDITAYGMDLYKEKRLAALIRDIVAATTHIEWVRLLYTFPAHVTDELIEVIATEPKVCKYLDMPIQHISDPLLLSMRRNITKHQTIQLIKKLRERIPQGSLRTTFIVGLPGETPGMFKELLGFIKETRFEKAGAFLYSREEGTPAYEMAHQISTGVKFKRLKEVMSLQRQISKDIHKKFAGQILKVLIDEKQAGEDHVYLGRTEFDAPEVDGMVFVRSKKVLAQGQFARVKITDCLEYDLVGEAL